MPIYKKILNNIHKPENIPLFSAISEIVSQNSDSIAKKFYSEMLSNPKAAVFLNHDIVKQRLTSSMSAWVKGAFTYRASEQDIDAYINSQLTVGHIHAKIGLPVSLVNYGMYLIKQDISANLINSSLIRADLGAALILCNQILDCALQVINECYEGDLLNNEKDSQAFKMQFSTHHLAFDCERLRASLSDWMRDLLLDIQQETFDVAGLLTIRHSNFGLWVTHKAKLFLSTRPEYTNLVDLLDDMDETMQKFAACFDDEKKRQKQLKHLNTLVTQAGWLLGEIAKEIIDQDNGRDPLTRLFNRRYLDTVMRHETFSSLKSGTRYGIIVIDIDFFKKINDSYGHNNGDRILAQLAEILTHGVRAGDFIFRLGGEEFLIVLGDINERVIQNIAEKICSDVRKTTFKLADGGTLAVTVSIGTALHDGHPDFNRSLKLADDALYKAKQNGRNQVVVADQA